MAELASAEAGENASCCGAGSSGCMELPGRVEHAGAAKVGVDLGPMVGLAKPRPEIAEACGAGPSEAGGGAGAAGPIGLVERPGLA